MVDMDYILTTAILMFFTSLITAAVCSGFADKDKAAAVATYKATIARWEAWEAVQKTALRDHLDENFSE